MRELDQNTWSRREIFQTFSQMDWPFFSLVFPIDVTQLHRYTKAQGLSFYHGMVYCVTHALNALEAFRVRIRGDKLVVLDEMVPSFTFLKPGSDAFQIATLPAGDDLAAFCRQATEVCRRQTDFCPQGPYDPDALIYLSSLPWLNVTAISHERSIDLDDGIPRIAWGKYETRDGRLVLNCGAECNHRLVDGYQVALFSQTLQGIIDQLPQVAL